MELNTISGLAIAGVICSVVLSMGVPIALFIAGRVKLKARISSFFIGAGTFLLFAMLLEQQLHVLVIQFCGLNAQSRPWLYYVYAALAAAVFEETGRLIAMKFWMKKWLDFPNALMYGIGHGGVEAILLGGLSGISNLVSMLMINSGAMQNTLAALPAESANQTVSQLSALWTTPAPLFFVSGIERISAIILHIGLSLLIYRAVKAGKCRTAVFTAVLAYGIHFIVDFFAVAGPALLPIALNSVRMPEATLSALRTRWIKCRSVCAAFRSSLKTSITSRQRQRMRSVSHSRRSRSWPRKLRG